MYAGCYHRVFCQSVSLVKLVSTLFGRSVFVLQVRGGESHSVDRGGVLDVVFIRSNGGERCGYCFEGTEGVRHNF